MSTTRRGFLKGLGWALAACVAPFIRAPAPPAAPPVAPLLDQHDAAATLTYEELVKCFYAIEGAPRNKAVWRIGDRAAQLIRELG